MLQDAKIFDTYIADKYLLQQFGEGLQMSVMVRCPHTFGNIG